MISRVVPTEKFMTDAKSLDSTTMPRWLLTAVWDAMHMPTIRPKALQSQTCGTAFLAAFPFVRPAFARTTVNTPAITSATPMILRTLMSLCAELNQPKVSIRVPMRICPRAGRIAV